MNASLFNTFILVAILLYTAGFMIYTPHSRVRKAEWLKQPLAHRGLYSRDQSIPENSLSAIREAMELGYGSEIDVVCSKDGQVMVFHDDHLDRMCGVPGMIEDYEAAALAPLKLAKSEDNIPTLKEVLKLVEGRVPLMIEIKTTPRKKSTVAQVKEVLSDYPGPITLVSFDPLIVREIRQQMPEVLRGQLMENALHKKQYSIIERLVLQFALMNGQTRPDYLSIHHQQMNLTYHVNRLLGGFGMVWPISSVEDEKKCQNACDGIIFEHYLPGPK